MPLSMAESTDPKKVFAEIQTLGIANRPNWTIGDFQFQQAPEDFYIKLKTLSKLRVEVKYERGFKVYLQGEKEGGGWAEHQVGTLPG